MLGLLVFKTLIFDIGLIHFPIEFFAPLTDILIMMDSLRGQTAFIVRRHFAMFYYHDRLLIVRLDWSFYGHWRSYSQASG